MNFDSDVAVWEPFAWGFLALMIVVLTQLTRHKNRDDKETE